MLEKAQQQQIVEFRNMGYGYKVIGTILKVKRDTVRNFCRRKGITGCIAYGQSVQTETKEEGNPAPDHCEYCGQEINQIERRGRKARFCSSVCRRKWWNENKDKKERRETAWYSFVCLNCGEGFKAYGNQNRKFCSVACSTHYRYGSERSV